MKDAANLIMLNKRTKQPSMYIDYANATSSEWSSEAVFATKKGTNAIRWDSARNGTLTLDTEVFDFGLLAMLMGSEVKEGSSNIFSRVEGVIDESRKVKLGEGISIDAKTLSVVKLKAANDPEHDGAPLYNASTATDKLPGQVRDLAVAANATTAKITFTKTAGATKYQILRGEEVVAEQDQNEFVDTGLTAETEYKYTIVATNEFGKGPKSPVVVVTTAATGVEELTQFTPTAQAKIDAANNVGEVHNPEPGVVTYSYADGIITFNEAAIPGDAYAIYYMERAENVRTLTIDATKFADSYEIYANASIRPQDGGADELVQIHYYNVKPQSNFTLTQSATEPTSLSIVFDIMPEGNKLAEMKVVA